MAAAMLFAAIGVASLIVVSVRGEDRVLAGLLVDTSIIVSAVVSCFWIATLARQKNKEITLGIGVWVVFGTLSFGAIPFIFVRPGSPGEFGDTFGTVNALFSGLALAGAIYTVRQQREELEQQREDLALHREEAGLQREATQLQKELNALTTLAEFYTQRWKGADNGTLKWCLEGMSFWAIREMHRLREESKGELQQYRLDLDRERYNELVQFLNGVPNVSLNAGDAAMRAGSFLRDRLIVPDESDRKKLWDVCNILLNEPDLFAGVATSQDDFDPAMLIEIRKRWNDVT